MDLTVIYSKTGKGVRLLAGKTRSLPGHLMRALALVDGSSPVSAILDRTDEFNEQQLTAAYDRLEQEGYIQAYKSSAPDLEWQELDHFSPIEVAEVSAEEFHMLRNAVPTDPPAELSDSLLNQDRVSRHEARQATVARRTQEEAELRQREMAASREADVTAQRRLDAEREAQAAAESRAAAESMALQEAEARKAAELKAREEALLRAGAERLEKELAEARLHEEARIREEAQQKARLEAEARSAAERSAVREAEERQLAEAQARAEALARAHAERLEREQAEAQTRSEKSRKEQSIAKRKAREAAELRAREEADARAEAERRALAEAEARAQAERIAKQEAEARIAAEAAARAEAQARAEAERIAREEAEARLEAERLASEPAEIERRAREAAENRQRELEQQRAREAADAKAESDRRAKAEAEETAEAERLAREEAEARSRAEALARAEAEARAEADRQALAEATARAEAERNARAQAEALAEAERLAAAEAAARAEAESMARAEAEARARAEAERVAQEKAALDARIEAERIAQAEAKALAKAEARARQQAERQARAEAKAQRQQLAAEQRAQAAAERMAQKAAKAERRGAARASSAPVATQQLRGAKRGIAKIARLATLAILPAALGTALGLQFVNLGSLVDADRMVSERLQTPVHIDRLRAVLLPKPQFVVDGLRLAEAPQLKFGSIRATPVLASLWGGQIALQGISVASLEGPAGQLGPALRGLAGEPGTLGLGNVRIDAVQLSAEGWQLPPFSADLRPDNASGWASARLASLDGKIYATLTPAENDIAADIHAENWTLPLGRPIVLSELHAQARADGKGIHFKEMSGRLYGGNFKAQARLDWQRGWAIEGDAELSEISLGSLLQAYEASRAPSGTASLSARYSARAASPTDLLQAPSVKGEFVVRDGAVLGVNLARAAVQDHRGAGEEMTRFDRLSGSFNTGGKGSLRFRQLKLSAKQLTATGELAINNGALEGTVNAALNVQGRQFQSRLRVDGTTLAPRLR